MRKQEALHPSLQLRDVHDLCKVALHNGQLVGVALARVLRVLSLQCMQQALLTLHIPWRPSTTNTTQSVETLLCERDAAFSYWCSAISHSN